jgi:cell division protease FtsH
MSSADIEFGPIHPHILTSMETISQTTYSQFIEQVKANQVLSVNLIGDRLTYKLKNEFGGDSCQTTITDRSINLPQVLRDNNVQFTTDNTESIAGSLISLALTAGLMFGSWLFLNKYSEGGGAGPAIGVNKSKPRTYNQGKNGLGKTGVSFEDVAGVDEAKRELQEVVDFLKDGEKYRRIGAKIPKGVLLVGPPGTGKTLLAKAVAGEAGVPFLSMSGSEFVEVYVGVGASRVRDLFKQAKRQAPCIIFIDELDAIGKSRSSGPNGNDEREQTLNQLLTEMDGFDDNSGVLLIAATNRPETLDAALKRPGRFDRQVLVDRPDKIGRDQILRVHARNVSLGEDVDLGAIATQTPGFAGADLANLVNEAALMAARNNRQAVLMADFHQAIERVIGGLENRSRILNPTERTTVAYHEVGHALVGALMPGGSKVSKISIVPRGASALGYTMQTPEEDRFLMVEDELRGRIAMLLGGRSAEEVVFNKVSTGASDDIQKATDLAERAITIYGMGGSPIAFERNQAQFLDSGTTRRSIGADVVGEIDRSIKQTIDQAHDMALMILKLNRNLLESTTQLLLADEVLEGDRLAAILSQVQAPAELASWLAPGTIGA